MSDDYVRAKIREALAAASNNRHDVQKLLITWAVRDQMLLLGMAKPHLKAIASGLIEHAVRTGGKGGETDTGPDQLTRSAIDDIITGAPPRKDKRVHRNIPPPKSTERQANAMRKLAAAFTRKKK